MDTSEQSLKIINFTSAQKKTSCGRSFIYQAMRENRFPKSIQLGSRRIGFLESEIDEWIAARISERHQKVAA